MSPTPNGDDIVIIASNAAHERNPSWYFNIKANPEVMLTLRGGHQGDYVAHEVPEGTVAGWGPWLNRQRAPLPVNCVDQRSRWS